MPKNIVLLSSRVPIGYVAIYNNEYLYYYLKSSKKYLESIASGTTFKEILGEKVSSIIFPLLPIE